MLYVHVAQVVLDRASVPAVISELVARCMAQHVRMYREGETRIHAHPSDHFGYAITAEGCAPLAEEDEDGMGVLPAELAQGS